VKGTQLAAVFPFIMQGSGEAYACEAREMPASPTVKVLFKVPAPETGIGYRTMFDRDEVQPALKAEEISADFLCTEERNHTTDDRDPSQRWEE
jgi:hypothetical protein